MSLCTHAGGCRIGPDGTPAKVYKKRLCATHVQRLWRNGHVGPPGRIGPRRPSIEHFGAKASHSAERFLELVPKDAAWGGLYSPAAGYAFVLWADVSPKGTRTRLGWKLIESWRRRGWIALHEARKGDNGVREVEVPHNARRKAREAIATYHENRRKFLVRLEERARLDEA